MSELSTLIDEMCDDGPPHLARDSAGREETRAILHRLAYSASPDGAVILVRGSADWHTHLCRCDACEPE